MANIYILYFMSTLAILYTVSEKSKKIDFLNIISERIVHNSIILYKFGSLGWTSAEQWKKYGHLICTCLLFVTETGDKKYHLWFELKLCVQPTYWWQWICNSLKRAIGEKWLSVRKRFLARICLRESLPIFQPGRPGNCLNDLLELPSGSYFFLPPHIHLPNCYLNEEPKQYMHVW